MPRNEHEKSGIFFHLHNNRRWKKHREVWALWVPLCQGLIPLEIAIIDWNNQRLKLADEEDMYVSIDSQQQSSNWLKDSSVWQFDQEFQLLYTYCWWKKSCTSW